MKIHDLTPNQAAIIQVLQQRETAMAGRIKAEAKLTYSGMNAALKLLKQFDWVTSEETPAGPEYRLTETALNALKTETRSPLQ